jgi:hypothetical protein
MNEDQNKNWLNKEEVPVEPVDTTYEEVPKDNDSSNAGKFADSGAIPLTPLPDLPDNDGSNGKVVSDTMRRRGFFEAIKNTPCPEQRLKELLDAYEQEAKEKLAETDEVFRLRLQHLDNRIEKAKELIADLKYRIASFETNSIIIDVEYIKPCGNCRLKLRISGKDWQLRKKIL